MPSFEDFHLPPAISATLARLGWSPEHPGVGDTTPTVARGHNLVAVAPPAPAYATPVLAAILSRLGNGRRALLIVPAAQLEEWGGLVHVLAREAGLRAQVARGTARAARRLHTESVDCLVSTPETALSLVMRSVLRMETLDAMLLAWPESLRDEELTLLMQDLPKEAQRIIYTSESQHVSTLVERYARKALTVGILGTTTAPVGPVRTTGTGWAGRLSALAELIELLDPASCVIWTVDQRYHEAINQAITAMQPDVTLVTGDAPPAATIIAYDLPAGDRLRQLVGAGEVVLLVPPGTEQYVASIAAPRRPLLLPGVLDAARAAESVQRRAIVKEIEESSLHPAVLTLAPLFERHDPVSVAAALYRLWTSSSPVAPPIAAEVPGATARIYVGLGKKDGANPNELVAVLTKELRVERTKIGRIELRDAYSLIEVPAQDAEHVAAALNGTTIRKKRVTARVDRKPTRSGGDGRNTSRPPRRADHR
ncbi:MAG TPA: DbpA RNA binding domain-containing protein [Gemmatimonadales bacterium]|nr:DbpA RNA binding domain-containing protein [Gemmatimonadales bacterium]